MSKRKRQIASEQEISDALMRLEKAVEEDKREAYEVIHKTETRP